MKYIFLICVGLIVLSGCSTIRFHRETEQHATEVVDQHVNGILGLIEFSHPVDLKARCLGSEWTGVTVERTFFQGLVSFIPFRWYDPWDVEVTCQ